MSPPHVREGEIFVLSPILFGGTRLDSVPLETSERTDLGEARPWEGDQWLGDTVRVPLEGSTDRKVDVPTTIIELNRQMTRKLTGIGSTGFKLSAIEGYRHRRDRVRLEVDPSFGTPLIHNYGHGGAGVTLFWSCAFRVAEMLASQLGWDTVALEELEHRVVGATLRN